MSWITELAKVYDNTIENDRGEDGNGRPIPMFHTANNASVTVLLNASGSFIRADVVEKNDRVTIMPCTESCAARTSGQDAYPLCDKLEYVVSEEKKHTRYINLLRSWVESKYATEKIKSVFTYVSKKSLLSDLKKSGIKEDDVSDFIRWEVEIPGDTIPQLWKDEAVFKSWVDFYNSKSFDDYCKTYLDSKEQEKKIRKLDLNYIDGTQAKIATYHPAKIRNAGSSAKIISSNDTSNYTFRGRFLTESEACQISSEATQKAHSALRWLIKRQGVPLGDGLSVVTWNAAGDVFPSPTVASTDLLPVVLTNTTEKNKDILEFDFEFEEPEKKEPSGIYSTALEFANAMKNRLRGYYGDISNPQNIMVMAIKEATPGQGRVSIVLYRELQNSDMIEALENWYSRLSWYTTYQSNDKTIVHTIGTPSPKTIAECAYGGRVKPQLVEKTVQRILPSILDGAVIPSDIERQCIKSASNLLVLEKNKHDEVLETACAVFKYNKIIKDREEYTLALEENRTSRDYLYGRLLAVAQQYENAALRKSGQDRETNAIRYMQQFSIHPSKTWLMLYKDKIPAYRRHLDTGLINWFEKKIQDITALFASDEYMNDKPLSGEFLLGYQCQLKAFRKNSDSESEENTEE